MSNKRKALLPIKKIITLSLLSIPALLLIFPALDFANQSYILFPASDLKSNVFAYDDKVFKGESQIKRFSHTRDELILDYLLRPGAQFPMVVINFAIGTSEKPIDLSEFKSVTIDFGEATIISVLIYFQTFVPGISLPGIENAITLRPNQYVLGFAPGVQHYTVGIEKFTTEPWWLATIKLSSDSLPVEDYKRVINFTIMFNPYSSNYVLEKPEHAVIKKVAFNKPMSIMNLAILSGVVLFYIGFYILQLTQHVRSYLSKIPEQKPVQVTMYYEQELSRIREFLESNYCDPDISTLQIYQKLGIPKARVSKLLHREYHLSLKQLTNKMRIEEAKRLLKNTDLRVTDIALNLGFNNITYFNHLFKSTVGVAPSEFRNQEE